MHLIIACVKNPEMYEIVVHNTKWQLLFDLPVLSDQWSDLPVVSDMCPALCDAPFESRSCQTASGRWHTYHAFSAAEFRSCSLRPMKWARMWACLYMWGPLLYKITCMKTNNTFNVCWVSEDVERVNCFSKFLSISLFNAGFSVHDDRGLLDANGGNAC